MSIFTLCNGALGHLIAIMIHVEDCVIARNKLRTKKLEPY